jgi:integrase
MGEPKNATRAHGMHRLSPAFVRRCTKPGVYFDGGGLRFRVYPNKTRLWVMRIVVGGRRRDISLGAFPSIPLADARSQAEVIRKAVAQGRDPTPQKRPADALSSHPRASMREDERSTFEQSWRAFWAAKEPQLSNGKHRDQWVTTMKTYVLPHIGHRPVADVTPSEVIQLLTPIWHTKEETARRVLQRIDAVFMSAITRQLREKVSPCLGVARELGNRRISRAHYAALPHAEVPAFLTRLRTRRGPLASRLAFEFLILTATRSGETRGATWAEIDLADRCWTIPLYRVKTRVTHIVPLSDRALAILREAKAEHRDSNLCFPNAKGKLFSDMVFTKTLRDMGLGERATAHGFRTAFKVWAAESGVRDAVSEAALAHTDPNKVRAAYRRTNFIEDRRSLMQAWSDFACQHEVPRRHITRARSPQTYASAPTERSNHRPPRQFSRGKLNKSPTKTTTATATR